ncbi:MAG TPA: ABC transporter ATP-binding protein [Candidatus Sulfopaludibacter sp.]|jgi:ABC-type multidrug transport system fused ATPase/permease subunit|nr:ABC transporter ATP-binding protein [Candidatus Sulfopaludibacter sp.]
MRSPKIRELLRPFRREYVRYMSGVVLRQALVIVGGYSLVWALRLCLHHTSLPEWLFVAGFVAFDSSYLIFDQALNFFFSKSISYPLFGRLRTDALEKVLGMPMEWHQRQSSGELVGKVNNGVGKVVQTAEGFSRELVPALIQTVFSLVPLLLISAATASLLAPALGVFLWLTILENRRRRPFAKRRHRHYGRDYGLFSESVQAIESVVRYGQQGQILRKYRRVQRQIQEEGLEEARIGNRFGFRRNLALSIAKRACQGMWIWQYRHNALDAASIMYLNMLIEQLLASFGGYASLLERLYDGLEPTRILVKLMSDSPAIAHDPSAIPVFVPDGVGIRMANVRFTYPRRSEPALRNLHLSITPGTVLGIVGRSGCGKTTLQGLLTRLFDVQRGAIEICGKDVRLWPLDQLRGMFSCVSQSGGAYLSGMRIVDVLRFTRPEATLREVVRVAKAACIHEDICRMPMKYRTRVGQGGVSLSKGQQQRVALAQALIAMKDDRKILVLDEFTSALDAETEQRILCNLEPWLAGQTVIIIAHRLATLSKLAHRIVVLDKEGVVEQGSHAELMERAGWYAEMVGLQTIGTSREVPGEPVEAVL